MCKGHNRIVLISGLIGASLLTGCGVTSTSLPSNLTQGGTGPLSIITTQFPDAIVGRTYDLVLSTEGGSGTLSSCFVTSGKLPTGLTWSINPTAPATCILSGTVTGAPGSYPVVVQASDSSPTPKTDSLSYTLIVRNDFTICAGPSSGPSGLTTPYSTSCTAASTAGTATSFPDAVQGRSYGASPLSQLVVTNLNLTADTAPVGHGSEYGNGPFTAATISGLAPGISTTGSGNLAVTASSVGAAGNYTVMVSVTDSPITVVGQAQAVVPARTATKTFTQVVHPPIQLAQSLGATWPDAVHGRAYGMGTGCTGGNCAPAVYTATNGLGGYVWPATAPASVSAAGLSCPAVATGSATYTCTAASITGGSATPGAASQTYNPNVAVTDTGNTATPAATATSDPLSARTDAVVVDAPLLESLTQATVTGTNPASLLPGVVNRSYGVIGAPPSYAASGGLGATSPTMYEWCLNTGSAPTGLGLGGVSIAASCPTYISTGVSLVLSAASITGAANTYNFTMELDDLGNASTPGSVASSASSLASATSLLVNPALVAIVTQTGNATAATKILDGVVNRSYGVINAGGGAPVYSATGGLVASGSYLWCINSGALPTGLTGISTTCGATTSTSASSVKLTSIAIGGTGGAFTFKVQADDGGNAAVPSTFVVPAADSMVGPTSLTVHPQIAVGLNFAPPPDAVTGRTYGSPAKTDLIYTVPAGQGLAPITMTGTGFPAPIACPTTNGTQQLNCNSANTTVTGATSAGTIIAADTANSATPAATVATDPSSQRTADTVNVRAALALTPPGAPLAAAVVGRSWGQGSTCGATGNVACAPAVYTVQNGLGGYSPGPVTGGPLSCAFASTGQLSGTYTCSTATEAAPAPSSVVALTVSDTANATTPNGSTTDSSQTLSIAAEMTITPPATVPISVHGRAYGTGAGCSGGACAPLPYTVSNGLGDYTATTATLGTTTDAFTLTFAAPTYSGFDPTIGAAGGSNLALKFSVTDPGNASTPANTVSDSSKSLATNAEMVITPPANPPVAVQGRAYGTGVGCSGGACVPLQYSLSSGLGNYTLTGSSLTWTGGGQTVPFTLVLAAPVFSGSTASFAPAVTGVGTLAFTGAETGNVSTPGNNVTNSAKTLTLNPEMTVTPPAVVPPAVNGRVYGTGSGCSGGACVPLQYTVNNGTGNFTLTGSSLKTTSDTFSLALAAPTFSGSDAAINATGGTNLTLTFTGVDAGNASTPGNLVIDSSKTLSTNTALAIQLVQNAVTNPPSLLPAVTNRTYGVIGASPVYTASGGIGAYTFPTSPAPFPAGFACGTTATTYTCSANPVSAAAQNYAGLNVPVSDTANASTPSGTATATTSLLVNPQIANAVNLGASWPSAVVGRAYGTGAGCSGGACTTPTYTFSGGLGTPYHNGSHSGFPLASSFAFPTGTTWTYLSAGVTSPAGPYTPNFTVTDTANAATPAGTAATDPASSVTSTLNVVAEMTVTPPASPFPVAVVGRHYGLTTDTCVPGPNCAPLTYNVPAATPGLGGPYTFTPNNFPTGFACVTSTNNGICSDGTAVGGLPGTLITLNVTAKDTANATTPQGAVTSTNGTLTVNPELNFTAAPTSPFAAAVDTRTYGQGSTCGMTGTVACTPLAYTIQNNTGLGGYNYALVVNSGNGGFACTGGSTSTNCTSASVTEPAGSYAAVHAAVTDTADASTPANTIASTNGALTVHNELTITPPATIATAVTSRSFGVGSTCGAGGTSACAPITYAVSNGLGNYTGTATMTTTAGAFTCTLSGSNYQCTSPDVTGSGTPTLSLAVTDTGNGSTPGNSKTDNSKTLAINPEMTFTSTPGATFVDAVAARTYGVGSTCGAGGNAACTPLTYTIQGGSGLGGYTYAFSPSINFACSSGAVTTNCTSSGVSGGANTYATAHASVTDTANASTPSNTLASTNGSLTVHPELNFTATPLSPFAAAVTGRTYGSGSACGPLGTAACVPLSYAIQAGSGLGGYAYAFLPSINFSCPGGAATTSCTSAAVGAAGTYATAHATVSDTANAATPSNTIASVNGSLTVDSELTLTPPAGPLPAAVTGRTYGQGSTCGAGGATACTTVNYTISNGLGNYVSPATMTTTAGTFACPLSSTTYQCSSATISGSSSTGLSLSASETGNGSTPGNSKTDNSETLTVNPEMNFTSTPGSPFATAVFGRTYGVGSNCGVAGTSACLPLAYTIQSGSGLGGYSYLLTVDGGNGGFTCTSGAATSNCTSSNITEVPGPYSAVHTAVTDTANAATPSNTITSADGSLTVDAALALNSPASPFPDAENGITYGSAGAGCAPGNVACIPVTYTVPFVNPTVDGLPPYVFSNSGFPTNLNCTQANAGAPAPNGTILNCAAASGISAPGPFPQAFSPSVMVTDTANASVPSAAVMSSTASLTVQPQLGILDTVLPNGLVGFAYNPNAPSGPGVTIKSQGGIGSVTWVGPGDGASGACAAPAAATLPGTTAMTFNDATQLFSTSGSPFVAGDKSAADGAYTFQVCVTDTGNAATPQTAALPNPTAVAPLVANNFVFDVLNTLAYTAETTTNAVDVINTASSTVVGGGIALSAAPTMNPNGVAVTPDGTRAYITLANNTFAVIDTITNAQITGSPFAMPAASTCTSLAGVAVTNDGRAYFACPTSSGTGGVVDVVSTVDNATLVAELATGNMPSGVAISPTVDATTGKTLQVYVGLNDVNELLVITNSATPAVASTVALNGLNTAPLGLAAVLNPGGDVYVYIAKQVAGTGNPGIEVVDATTASQVNDFALFPATRVPVGAAATPDGTEVYVTLNDSTVGTSYVSVVDNTATPALRSVIPYGLPDPTVLPPPADTGAVGVAIPPLSGATPDFLIFIAQSLSNNVAVLLDNQGAGNKPLVQTAVTLNGATPAPQGVANIPVPTVAPKLP